MSRNKLRVVFAILALLGWVVMSTSTPEGIAPSVGEILGGFIFVACALCATFWDRDGLPSWQEIKTQWF